MSLRLLIDEDSQARSLVARLRQAGHDVLTAGEAGLMGQDDAAVLAGAHSERRAVLTLNVDHFRQLHQSGAEHSGILVVCRGDNPAKDMGPADIARAIANIDRSGIDVAGQFAVLNAWNY